MTPEERRAQIAMVKFKNTMQEVMKRHDALGMALIDMLNATAALFTRLNEISEDMPDVDEDTVQ